MNKSAPCKCCGNTEFTAIGCNSLGIPGITVDVYQPTTNTTPDITGTTGSDGKFKFTVSITSSYAIQCVDNRTPSRFATSTKTTFTSANRTPSLTLSANSNYVCTDYCADPFAKTLHVTSPCGSTTITYTTNMNFSGVEGWTGCILCSGGTRTRPPDGCTSTSGNSPFDIFFRGTGTFKGFSYNFDSCCLGNVVSGDGGLQVEDCSTHLMTYVQASSLFPITVVSCPNGGLSITWLSYGETITFSTCTPHNTVSNPIYGTWTMTE